jgi:chromate reductase
MTAPDQHTRKVSTTPGGLTARRFTTGYFVGSLSAESINRALAKALMRLAPESLTFVEIPIRDLPLYNRDLDADYPPAGRALKDAIASVDAYCSSPPNSTAAFPVA